MEAELSLRCCGCVDR